MSWYNMQKMQVRWDLCLSVPFSVSNGVRQGSVLSPYLFVLYLDNLLVDLSTLVLVVTGEVVFLVRLLMQMMLFY